ncbi:hypothetical protein MN608_11602 [Microdochium nivale]|nr:hypothetical protein MN608_11602 [Microdochium nivale]
MHIFPPILLVATTAAVQGCVVPGSQCDIDAEQLTCSERRDKVYQCSAATGLWEFLWDCTYPSRCVDGSSFCIMDFPPPPVEEWGHRTAVEEKK